VVEPPRQGSGNLTLRLAVITENGEAVAWTLPDIGTPSAPEQLAAPRGTLIRFPVSSRSSGRTLDEIWHRRAGSRSWVHLDPQSWRSEAEQRLRTGETLAISFDLDLRPQPHRQARRPALLRWRRRLHGLAGAEGGSAHPDRIQPSLTPGGLVTSLAKSDPWYDFLRPQAPGRSLWFLWLVA